MIMHHLVILFTKEVAMSRDSSALSIGTKWPALNTILNYKFPASLKAPAIFPFTAQELNCLFRNYSALEW